MLSNLPALQVVIPMMAAPICTFMPSRLYAWFFTTAATWLTFVVSLLLFNEVSVNGSISYEMGGWKPPFGIEYKVDRLNSFMLVLVSGIGAISLIFAKPSVDAEVVRSKQSVFYATYLLCFTGLLGILITNDAFNIYVFLEISSLATYALIAMGSDRRSLTASFEYLILGTIGATFILIAVGLLYIMVGTLNITDLAARLPIVAHTLPVKASLAFFTIGLALKIAMFPLHLWLANAYTNAPSFVSVFLSATATKVSIYVLIRVLYSLFGFDFTFNHLPITEVLVVFSLLAILIASLVAIFQRNIKRMLAYSSVAQIGYIILGISLGTAAGLTASVVHIINHALAKAALFIAVGAVMMQVGGVRLSDFRGIGKYMPFTMAGFVLAGLSLIGVPLTAGFVSKWLLLKALIDNGQWLIVAAVLVSSLLAVVYVWRVVERAYFHERKPRLKKVREAPLMVQVALWIMVVLSIVFGIYTEATVGVAQQVAIYLTQT